MTGVTRSLAVMALVTFGVVDAVEDFGAERTHAGKSYLAQAPCRLEHISA